MLKLMLLRHAKAIHSAQYDDIDRPLTPRGKADAELIGRDMTAHDEMPDLALVSSSCRTRETWDVVRDFVGPIEPIFEEGLYHASADAMLKRIRLVPEDRAAVLLVGHNPGTAYLANALAGAGDKDLRHAMKGKFPTCALAVFSFNVASWRDISPQSGKLERFVYPKLFGGSAE